MLMGGCIPKEWKESRVLLVHQVRSKKELKIPPTSVNYKCSVQVVYDGVKTDNKCMGGREWHARRYTRGFQNVEKDRG